jgi:TFIIF-interacting CTD phosphatase-like protein
MKDIIIVDNSPIAYAFHPENALPISSWYDDPRDKELLKLAPILEKLS